MFLLSQIQDQNQGDQKTSAHGARSLRLTRGPLKPHYLLSSDTSKTGHSNVSIPAAPPAAARLAFRTIASNHVRLRPCPRTCEPLLSSLHQRSPDPRSLHRPRHRDGSSSSDGDQVPILLHIRFSP